MANSICNKSINYGYLENHFVQNQFFTLTMFRIKTFKIRIRISNLLFELSFCKLSSSRGVATNFLKGGIKCLKMSAMIVGRRENFVGFRPTKTAKFGTLSMISHALSCLYQENLTKKQTKNNNHNLQRGYCDLR